MSIIILLKKAQQGDQLAVIEIINRYKNLLLSRCFIKGQTKEEHSEFYKQLRMELIDAIRRFDFNYQRKSKNIF